MTDTQAAEAEEKIGVISAWFDRNIGPVQSIERQPRWRWCWIVTALQDGKPVSFFVRGSRGGNWPPHPLSYEAAVHKYFMDQGLKVAGYHGYIEELPAIVMEVVEGQVDLSTGKPEHRPVVIRQLVEEMAKMHALDPEPFYGLGEKRALDGVAVTRGYIDQVEGFYRATKNRPEPCIEFIMDWLRRNVPTGPVTPAVIATDSGQFLFQEDRLTALIDFELVMLGDRFTDLGGLRTRNRAEPIGDLDEVYRAYAEASGVPLDYERIRYHGIGLSMVCPLVISGELGNPTNDVLDYFEYLTWMGFCLKDSLEQIAEARGYVLEPAPPLRQSGGSRYAAVLTAIEQTYSRIPASDDHMRYFKAKQPIMVRFLARLDKVQPWLEERYLDDVRAVTGADVSDWREADTLLERHVLEHGARDEEALLNLFYRQTAAFAALMADREDWPNKYDWLTRPMAPIGQA